LAVCFVRLRSRSWAAVWQQSRWVMPNLQARHFFLRVGQQQTACLGRTTMQVQFLSRRRQT
jgi:hypothetical protein